MDVSEGMKGACGVCGRWVILKATQNEPASVHVMMQTIARLYYV